MKRTKLLFALLLILCLSFSVLGAQAEEAIYSHLGETLADFTVTTIDGGTFTLSQALQEKDMVLINLWATWCGPCEREFPYMQEAYALYQDKVEIIALSVEPTDTPEVLAAYAQAHDMTFPVANDAETGLGHIFATVGIPTTLVVDRFGTICMIEIGSQPSTSAFTRVFDYFTGEDYTASQVLYDLPPALPNVERADAAALSAALNDAGGDIVFGNADDPYTWPMIPVEKDGRSAVASTNAGESESESALLVTLTAEQGDVLAFDFATSTEAAMDLLTVSVDDWQVKAFGGEHGWTSWGIVLDAGEHTVAFRYVKDASVDGGEDAVWLDNVRLLTGMEAAACLSSLPAYPAAAEFALVIQNPEAKEIVFEGEYAGVIYNYFGAETGWILNDDTLYALATLTADVDPETAFVYSIYDGSATPVADALRSDGAGYDVVCPIDTMVDTGYPYTVVNLYPSAWVDAQEDLRTLLLIPDEENANAFIEMLESEIGVALTWRYADGTSAATDASAVGTAGQSAFVLVFQDQDGAPVPGVIANVCDDSTCTPMTTGEDGRIAFTAAPYPYEIHILKLPAGYDFDLTQDFQAPAEGGEMRFVITKE